MTTTSLAGLWELRPHVDLRSCSAPVPDAWQWVYPDTPGVDVLTYQRRVDTEPLQPGERLWLRFEAVATAASVRVNGQDVGSHVGDWIPFQFEITSHAAALLEIEVTVDRLRPGPVREVNGHPQQSGHITKGFHDVLSAQHAGIWQDVSLVRTRSMCVRPNGAWISTDGDRVRIHCELAATDHTGGTLSVTLLDPHGNAIGSVDAPIAAGSGEASVQMQVENPQKWSPDAPNLYTAVISLLDSAPSHTVQERFGFRRVHVSDDGKQILLNNTPIFISGILDWGHEPHRISPAPTAAELRERFGALRNMGFNCICICMWYPPRAFYDLADEMGILIWQEHPIWKSDMSDARIEEYKEQFEEFFRMDRNHPSVAIVSGACEHEEFNPKLATWWWAEAQRQLSDRLIQIQTAFLAWTDLEKTDLYDEHTYEGSGRWAFYLRDLDAALEARPAKPIVMGESVLGVGWPDVARYDAIGNSPWWVPPALDKARALEQRVNALDGEGAARGLVAVSDRSNLALRKFQTELFRMNPQHAGMVANSIRDVAICPCGFLDDFGRWRFDFDDVRAFMGDAVLLIQTPEHRLGFAGGSSVRADIGLSNFSPATIEGDVVVRALTTQDAEQALRVCAAPGQSPFHALTVELPVVDRPTPVPVRASIGGVRNNWTLWALPRAAALPHVSILRDAPFEDEEIAFGFEERKYSSGWGLPVATWAPRQPDPQVLLPHAPGFDSAPVDVAAEALVVTHRLTPEILEALEAGARVLHLPSKARGSLPTTTVTGFGQVPWIRPVGPLARFGRDWIEDLLEYDLMRLWTRGVCVSDLGLVDAFEPFIRLLYTHDMADKIREIDMLSATRVGRGVLAICSCDLHDEPGRVLLAEVLNWLDTRTGQSMSHELDIETLRGHLLADVSVHPASA